MEEREKVLQEALWKNEQEKERWLNYKKENETAIENLDNFSKHIVMNVMVPVGRKAYFPGQIIHTNEVLVGHYQGYFSHCSAHQAKEICQLRLKQAEEHLKLLQTEEDLWQNKLETPYLEGAVPTRDQIEITEPYDEEEIKQWRIKHRESIKRCKLLEKEKAKLGEEPKKVEDNDDVFALLEEAELMEELQNELNNLETGNEVPVEVIRKMISGETDAKPSKPRISHAKAKGNTDEKLEDNNSGATALEETIVTERSFDKIEDSPTATSVLTKKEKIEDSLDNKKPVQEQLQGIVKKADLNNDQASPTNNNSTPNPNMEPGPSDYDSDDSDNEALWPEEAVQIRNEAMFLPLADQIGFYEYQLQILSEKLRKKRGEKEKTAVLDVIQVVERLLEKVEIRVGDEEIAQFEKSEGSEEQGPSNEIIEPDLPTTSTKDNNILPSEHNQKDIIPDACEIEPQNSLKKEDIIVPEETLRKKRISFASEDQTIEFNHTETVCEMLQNSASNEVPTRDIITLDEPLVDKKDENQKKLSKAEQKKQFYERLARHLEHTAETQSVQRFDLVTNILNESEKNWKTLHITFRHSQQTVETNTDGATEEYKGGGAEGGEQIEQNIPRSPADFYENYLKLLNPPKEIPSKVIYVNSYPGEEDVKAPILKESNRNEAYQCQKAKFNSPNLASKGEENQNQILMKIPDFQPKSILRNKEAVANEPRMSEEVPEEKEPKKKKKKSKEPAAVEDPYMSAYNKVMNEVVEKPLTEPEPLPNVPFVDAHAPKKRVSRFKLTRINPQTT